MRRCVLYGPTFPSRLSAALCVETVWAVVGAVKVHFSVPNSYNIYSLVLSPLRTHGT